MALLYLFKIVSVIHNHGRKLIDFAKLIFQVHSLLILVSEFMSLQRNKTFLKSIAIKGFQKV
ncbi:MAG: hypothetical protein QOK54_05370, partial [Nitrososphaeraceae archaeon]|nr:hypothetical protein [Nitrososphaeraceae archaeon]